MEQMNELREQIQQLLDRQAIYDEQMEEMIDGNHGRRIEEYEDITTVLTSGDQIQLESYRSIPEFSGNKNQYRSWRNQVTRRMKMIEDFKNHPKYEAALGIIRAKITGAASDVITNNKTAYNIDAFIARLDSTYADQRPLYIIEAEMASIRQSNKTLQEYFDEINQALNLIISKITLSYKTLNEQKPLIFEAQQKAIRTFIIGLRSQTARNILYGQRPKTLAEALTTAQTVFYDNQYLHLDQPPRQDQKMQQRKPPQGNFGNNQPRAQPQGNFGNKPFFQNNPAKFNLNLNCNQPPAQRNPEPMDVDRSNQIKQWNKTNPQPNEPQKREYDFSEQQRKRQRINQLQEIEPSVDLNDGYEEDLCLTIPDELLSNSSNICGEPDTASAFLEE